MKQKINNKFNLSKEDITEIVLRSRALILNSKKELLMVFCENTYQFPGGHVEEGETLMDTLKREIREETGIILKEDIYPIIYQIQHHSKNYPCEGTNRYTELNYYLINTDEKYDLNNLSLDEYEKYSDFKLEYIPLNDIEIKLKETEKLNPKNILVYKEILEVVRELKKFCK